MPFLSPSFLTPCLCFALKLSARATLGHSGIGPLSQHFFHLLSHAVIWSTLSPAQY